VVIDVCAMLCLPGHNAEEARRKDIHGALYWWADDAASLSLGMTFVWAETKPNVAMGMLEERFGEFLSLHQDPKGFCFFPNNFEPAGESYELLISDLAETETLWVGLSSPGRSQKVGVVAADSSDSAATDMLEASSLWAMGKLSETSPYYQYFENRFQLLSGINMQTTTTTTTRPEKKRVAPRVKKTTAEKPKALTSAAQSRLDKIREYAEKKAKRP
jgi:hypothetical protein